MSRPKSFDRDEVLDRAMAYFWAHGYEATSIGDLVEHLGVGRQSLYDTFGDKHALYLDALARYRERYGGMTLAQLAAPGPVRRILREFFDGAVEAFTATEHGCMLINATAERCPGDAAVREVVCGNIDAVERALHRRLSQARRDGELGGHHDPRALARYFVSAFHGLCITAKATRDRAMLEQIVDVTLSVLG